MSKLKKLLPKRDLRARWLWVLALALTAVKLGLCSFQLIVASPDLSPIDDTLMFNLAKSISAGNWLGEYDWLTLGKHSFYALWLAFLNLLHVNIVVGGQALFAVSCLVLLAALKPVMRTNWGRLFVFAVTLYTASWAENTLRVYRDNIYPSLVLLALAGLLGAFTRFREKPLRALPYYVAAGLSLAAAWLCHEDNALLLPFVMEYNKEAAKAKYRTIAEAMGVDTSAMDDDQAAQAAVDAVKALAVKVRIPQHLSELGVPESGLPTLAQAAFNDVCTPGNPRKAVVEEILEVYKKAF